MVNDAGEGVSTRVNGIGDDDSGPNPSELVGRSIAGKFVDEALIATGGAGTVTARADGLYRAGNLPAASPLAPRAAVFRYTAGGTVAVAPGFRIKASGELWAFSNDVPAHQDLDLAFHLGVVGTF